MNDQKEIVHQIYTDIYHSPEWMALYRKNPKKTLENYHLSLENQEKLKPVLKLF